MPDVELGLTRGEVQVLPARLTGNSSFSLAEGGRLRMQLKPYDGDIDDFLDETVPAGKSWRVDVMVSIVETDI